MKCFVLASLAVALVAAVLLIFIGGPTYLPPLPPRPADAPAFVLEPANPDSKHPPLVPLPNLSNVDRHVVEPAGLVKPRYCLLVFGPEAKTRVWIVEDGDTLFVDCNANGDLTDAGEAFTPADRRDMMTGGENGKQTRYSEWIYTPRDVSPADGSGKHTGLKLVRYQTGDEPPEYVLSVWVGGVILQHAGWGPLFAERRDTAPVVHFGGPVVAKSLRGSTVRVSEDRPELHFCIGTPGLGSHSFAHVSEAAVPAAIRPVVEIAWPTEAAVFKERFALTGRC